MNTRAKPNFAAVVRATTAAFNRGDLDAALAPLDSAVVLRLDPQWPENHPRFGIDEVRSFFEALTATLGNGESEIEEPIELDDRVIVRVRARFQGKASDLRDDVVFTQLLTFRNGRIVMFEYFLDFDEALRAVAGPAR